MPNINSVFIGGNLTRDPELRYTPGGRAVCSFTVAINRKWTTKDGEQREDACFVGVTTWEKQAEACSEHLSKSSQVLVEGSLKQDKWQDKQTGQNRSKIKVNAFRVHFIGRPQKKEEAKPQPEERAPQDNEVPF